MLCSLCFKPKKDSIQLSCGHLVCLSCIPKRPASQKTFKYQCQTCLENHHIDLRDQMHSDAPNSKEFSRVFQQNISCIQQSKCIFCWNCHEAIKLNDYIKGRHRQHSVQSYEQAIPSIKNLMLKQLNKSIGLKDFLKQTKQVLQTNNLQKKYQIIIDRMNDFFQKQIQMIERKRQKLMEELNSFYQNNLESVEKQLDMLNPFIEEIQSFELKISHFLTDRTPITEIGPISGLLKILEQYQANLKEAKFFVPNLPELITKCSLKQPIQNSCQLFANKSTPWKRLSKVSIKRPDFKEQFDGTNNQLKYIKNEHSNLYKLQKDQLTDTVINRKVRLVEKLKGKMKYSSSFCSTTHS